MADAAKRKRPVLRDVLYVGNNGDGTADVIQPERMAEIQADPARMSYFLGIREEVGEGHDQFVDDMFSSRNGRVLYVSRPSLAEQSSPALARALSRGGACARPRAPDRAPR